MKRTILLVTAWAASLVIVSAASAVAVQQITGRSVKNGSLTGIDIKNGSLAEGDLSGPVRSDLRDPVVVREALSINPIEGGLGTWQSVECPLDMIAVNGGIYGDELETSATVTSERPAKNRWEMLLGVIDIEGQESTDFVPAYAICV